MSINALWQKKSLLQSFCIKQHDIVPIVKRAEVELLFGGDQKGQPVNYPASSFSHYCVITMTALELSSTGLVLIRKPLGL